MSNEWKFIDCTDSLIFKNPTVTGQYSGDFTDSKSKGGTYYQMYKGTITFNFYGSKLKITGLTSTVSQYGTNFVVKIDNVQVGTIINLGSQVIWQDTLFQKENLSKSIHKVEIINESTDKLINFDGIEVDTDGYLVDPSNIVNEEFEFPIKLLSDDILEAYCNTLTNGEEQILITDSNKIYISNGNGSYRNLSANKEVLDLLTKDDNGNLLFNGKPISSDNQVDLSEYVTKEDFKEEINKINTSSNIPNKTLPRVTLE